MYLVPSYELLFGIKDALWRMKQLVLFGLIEEFKKERLEMRVRDSCFRESSMREALAQRLLARTDAPEVR